MHALRYFSFVVLLPYLLGPAPNDSSYNEYSLGIGSGEYAYSDCSGTHTKAFDEAGVKFTHKFESPFRLGAAFTATRVGENESPSVLLYPDIALDFHNFSLGTTGLRIGAQDKLFFEIAALDQAPMFTGKGALRSGVGAANLMPFSRVWIGMNVIPYSRAGFATQLELPLEKNQFFYANWRYGTYNNHPEFGVSIGMRFVN